MISKTELSELEISEIKELLDAIEQSDFENIDQALGLYGKQLVASYKFKLITPSQKEKLSEYKKWKENKNKDRDEITMSEKLLLLEQYDEPPTIYQMGYIDGRIVVASVKEYMEGKETRHKANGGISLEIFRDRTPKAYEYAKNKYQLSVRLE